MADDVTVEKDGETQDSGMDVFKASVHDSEMEFSFDTVADGVDLRVYHVRSTQRGDMKRLLDHVCREYECETVRFVNVISERLRKRLEGFEKKTMHVPDDHPTPMAGEPYQVLEGDWKMTQTA